MKYSHQLEFDFKDIEIDPLKGKSITTSDIIPFGFQQNTRNKFYPFVEFLKKEVFIKDFSIDYIGKKIEINIKFCKGGAKTFWAFPSILEVAPEEYKVLRKVIFQEPVPSNILLPLIKKYLISRPCHWRFNWTSQGKYHYLQDYFDKLNYEYFMGKLTNRIFWSKSRGRKNKRKKGFCLGFFCKGCAQIFINPLLDSNQITHFIVEVIVYHEMVHAYLFNDYMPFDKSHSRKFKELYYKHPKVEEVESILKTNKIYNILRKRVLS